MDEKKPQYKTGVKMTKPSEGRHSQHRRKIKNTITAKLNSYHYKLKVGTYPSLAKLPRIPHI